MKKLILFLLLIPFITFSQSVKKSLEFTLTTGSTVTINLQSYSEYVMIKGAQTLSVASYVITNSGTPANGMIVKIYWQAVATYSGANVVTIFGTSLTRTQAATKGIITCLYNNSAWNVIYVPNFTGAVIDSSNFSTNNFGNGIKKETGITLRIDTTTAIGFKGSTPNKTVYLKYDDTTLTAYGANKLLRVKASGIDSTRIVAKHVTKSKLEDIPRGSVLAGGFSNRPTFRNAKTSAAILIGDGTDVQSIVPTGDVTISAAGVTAITTDAIVVADLNDASNLKKEVITAALSFCDSCITVGDTIKIYVPYRCTVNYAYSTVTKMIGSTDDGRIDLLNATGAMVHWAVTKDSKVGYTTNSGAIASNNTIGEIASNNTIGAGDYIRVLMTKATKRSGDVLLSIFVTRY